MVKKEVFKWNPQVHTPAFEALKTVLLFPPVLLFPDPSKPLVIKTNASDVGIGTMLLQKGIDGCMHLIACASRPLDPAERNYGVTELETLAVIWALTFFRAAPHG